MSAGYAGYSDKLEMKIYKCCDGGFNQNSSLSVTPCWLFQHNRINSAIFFLCLQHLFPDADQDLEELEVAQQEMLFDKMENKEAYDGQGTQVWWNFIYFCL